MTEPGAPVDPGFDVHLCDPAGAETGDVISVQINDDARAEIGAQKLRGQEEIKSLEQSTPRKLNRPGFRGFRPGAQQPVDFGLALSTAEEIERDLVELLASCTISWNLTSGGKPLECTKANAVMIYTEYPFLRGQVHEAMSEHFGLEDVIRSPAFEYTGHKSAQAGRRHWAAWNREFKQGHFEAAALAMAEHLRDSLLATPEHDLRLREGRMLPVWTGERAKNLAVIFTHGFGDGLLLGRYLGALCARVERVSAIVAGPLRELFEKNTPEQVDVYDFAHCADGFRDADAHAYSFFLPHETGQGYGEAAWIAGNCSKREQLPGAPARIGICWCGATENPNNRLRSIPPVRLAPLLEIPGLEWHSLQADKRAIPPEGDVIDHAPELRSFQDTADLIATLDLTISIDSAVANLTASMGAPLWALLEPAADCDFRWGTADEQTPWFGQSTRMFRQRADRKWKPVIRRVAEALAEWIAKRDADAISEAIRGSAICFPVERAEVTV